MKFVKQMMAGGLLAAAVSMLLAFPAMAEDFKVAIVMPGNITDQSWNQAGYEGLMDAKKALGIEVAYSEKVAQPDQAEAMADYARRGYDVVIGHGGEFQEAANRVAKRHPDTLFVVHNGTEPGKNIATLDFYYKQFGYLLGYIAGKMSKSGKVGFIGAQKIKFSTDLVESYEVGFKKVHPNGKVFIAWTNDWDDIAKGKEAALNQISLGADVIFPTMDNAAVGSLQAAKEKGVWGFYLYYDSIVDWPDTVLQSAIMDIKAAMVDLLALAKAGKAEGKNYNMDVNSPKAARLGTYHSAIPADVKAEVEGLITKMKSGELRP
jgi:basic membrane protein A